MQCYFCYFCEFTLVFLTNYKKFFVVDLNHHLITQLNKPDLNITESIWH